MHQEFEELERRNITYKGSAGLPIELKDKTAIIVDDGIATGATMLAALKSARALAPARLIAAAPVAARSTIPELNLEADEFICAAVPEPFQSVGQWYENFEQTTDDEVRAALRIKRGPI
jgi:putative phosphoribosyl transferase